ncbi:cobalamin-binding protein [Thalassoroseus pseudoceratinae]|uniref:cobalamin-binding protein n=1 Tax=Thalassoroseus pseudoceratinae TaxID=2713176 RepID=UPI001423B19E|nr:cobalamin-binding protein [Thalassoroseus pseudoceratinae]
MPERIVSLIPSATEIVCALGLEDQLVGRSHECDFPASIAQLPVCSRSRVDPSASSREIDRQVKSVLRDAISIYEVDTQTLDELEPTLIITQAQCDVCAVSLNDVERAVGEFVRSSPRIISLSPMGLPDVWNDVFAVAKATNVPERGRELATNLQSRLTDLRNRTQSIVVRPSIACLEWMDPLMAAGNWVPELVEIAGGRNCLGKAGEHSPWMNWDDLLAADPDVIVIMPCGFDIARVQTELLTLTECDEWSRLRAVQTGRVYLTDGNQYFNRPGPRLVESAEILAEILHGRHMKFDHQGSGWVMATDGSLTD